MIAAIMDSAYQWFPANERFTPETIYKALAMEKKVLRDKGHPLAAFLTSD